MTEQDRKTRDELDGIRKTFELLLPDGADVVIVRDAVALIDRLDKQITEVKEAGEPILFSLHDFVGHPDELEIRISLGLLRRFDEALKEVKDE